MQPKTSTPNANLQALGTSLNHSEGLVVQALGTSLNHSEGLVVQAGSIRPEVLRRSCRGAVDGRAPLTGRFRDERGSDGQGSCDACGGLSAPRRNYGRG
jgi:hypothetical protein